MSSNHFRKHECGSCGGFHHDNQCCPPTRNRTQAIGPFTAVEQNPTPQTPIRFLAYGSFFNDIFATNVPVVALNQKVVFTTTGPLLNVAPAPVAPTTDLQVAVGGVYEITADLESIHIRTGAAGFTRVLYQLFVNDTIPVAGSIFGSYSDIAGTAADPETIAFSIGDTVQRRLNPNDRLSIRVIALDETDGEVQYVLPSLVVNKIDD